MIGQRRGQILDLESSGRLSKNGKSEVKQRMSKQILMEVGNDYPSKQQMKRASEKF